MKFPIILSLFLLVSACGGSDGDDGDSTTVNVPTPGSTPIPPQNEEEEPSGCLSTARRESINTFLTRVSNISQIIGAGELSTRNADGSFTTVSAEVAYDYLVESPENWLISATACFAEDSCEQSQYRLSILADNCLYVDSFKTSVRSSSNSNLSYSYILSDGTRGVDTHNLTSGKVRTTETYSLNGITIVRFRFQQQ